MYLSTFRLIENKIALLTNNPHLIKNVKSALLAIEIAI